MVRFWCDFGVIGAILVWLVRFWCDFGVGKWCDFGVNGAILVWAVWVVRLRRKCYVVNFCKTAVVIYERRVSSWVWNFHPGANPTIASYNASVVNFYNATGSLARFKNKNILFYLGKVPSLLQRWRCSCKFKDRRIGSRIGTCANTSSVKNVVVGYACKNFIILPPKNWNCLSTFFNRKQSFRSSCYLDSRLWQLLGLAQLGTITSLQKNNRPM
jgi:hypothetical protein